MSATAAMNRDPVLNAAVRLVEETFGQCPLRDYAVRFWDGSIWQPAGASASPRFTIVLRHPGALRNLLSGSDLRAGEAYIYDGVDIEGDIEGVFGLADTLLRRDWHLTEKVRAAKLMAHLPTWHPRTEVVHPPQLAGKTHSIDRDRRAVTYHYDISNDFYRLWLDDRMAYSCAYFESRDESLEAAQTNKLDYICRKLRLRAGERLLDFGCGWGSLVIHAAQRYGVNALGITLSRAQAELANERIRQAGLEQRCRVELCDYRDVPANESYDKAVSVGMFEHVGEEVLPQYFERAFRLLRAGGVFLNHGIARAALRRPKRATFISTYVFPDGDLVPISTTLRVAEGVGFEIRDVESLREHYALTLRQWVSRLEKHADEARRVAGEVMFRIFRLYMAGSAHWFATGRNNIYQALMVKPDGATCEFPLTRTDWYARDTGQ